MERTQIMTLKLQSGRSRAWRHKYSFALVQADFMMSAFWVGRWPDEYHIYYTIQYIVVLICKIVDFSYTGQHYFLLDFCYMANLYVLLWMWCFPTSGIAFNIADGVCGLLAISIVVFRNSCVPHDFNRITNAYVHHAAIVAMVSVKIRPSGALLAGMQAGAARAWYLRLWDCWAGYMAWAIFYAAINFFIARKRIDRKQRDTLYKYFAHTLGIKEKLPKKLRPYSEVVFMLGHQALFLAGIWWLLLPAQLQGVGLFVALFVFFHNGGRFYVDHFWKAYERNCAQYVDAAYTAMSEAKAQAEAEKVRGS